jgi:hypothetical protein
MRTPGCEDSVSIEHIGQGGRLLHVGANRWPSYSVDQDVLCGRSELIQVVAETLCSIVVGVLAPRDGRQSGRGVVYHGKSQEKK